MHAINRIPYLSFLDAAQGVSQRIKKPLPYIKAVANVTFHYD
ncbi:hypothetical protein [Staphylococcus saprophyticus]|nr:hypothetical protein [Staphylococcus saprophyticus]MDW4089139.1 hypothetical protein [Staphylococcus saprophyticus]